MQHKTQITHQINGSRLATYTRAFNLDFLKGNQKERIMRRMKGILIAASLLGACALNATPLAVNSDAVGKSSLRFLEQIDDQMPGFVRGLSYQKPTEFNALQFAAMLNCHFQKTMTMKAPCLWEN
jgi:hypothetical protein